MDPNPARNRKLTPVPAPVEETPDTTPDSAPETQTAPGPYFLSPSVLQMATQNSGGYISFGTSAPYAGMRIVANNTHQQYNFGFLAARDADDVHAVTIAAYAAINGQLYTYKMQMDRLLWDSLDPRLRDSPIRKAKMELAVKIAEQITEVYVDGQRWNPPADQTTKKTP